MKIPKVQGSALEGLAGEIVCGLLPETEASEAALLLQFLGAFGNAIGRNAHFKVESTRHYLNLFMVIVGQSSNARKGTSWDHIKRLFEKVEMGWTQRTKSGLVSGEGLIFHVRDPDTEAEKIDIGVIDKRLLIVESEFASVLRVIERQGNSLSALLRNAWDHGSLSTLARNSPLKATGAHISIIGHITTEELQKYFTSTEAANGFGNRFLWVAVNRSKKLPNGGRLDDQLFDLWSPLLHKAIHFGKTIGEIRLSPEAQVYWESDLYNRLTEDRTGIVGSITARAAPQVIRLACLYAVLARSAFVLIAHLKAADEVWKYCDESARLIFGENIGDDLAQTIEQALSCSPEGLTRTDISGMFDRNVESGKIGRALRHLESARRAFSVEIKSGGRPSLTWFHERFRHAES